MEGGLRLSSEVEVTSSNQHSYLWLCKLGEGSGNQLLNLTESRCSALGSGEPTDLENLMSRFQVLKFTLL